MSEMEEPELHMIRFPGDAGTEWRAQAERMRQEARRRYIDYVAARLPDLDQLDTPTERAAALLDALTEWSDIETGERCRCGCHPTLPSGDLHDFGFSCPCQKTEAARKRHWEGWFAEMDAFWSSPEGERITAAQDARQRELLDWLAGQPDIEVRSHGGWAPEQWWGSVDGHSFYFRERHDEWRVELDLRPSGRFSTVWVGGDVDDDASFEEREIEGGDVIAEGTTGVAGYGDSPLTRLQFIVGEIRTHLLRQACAVHTTERAATEAALGRRLAWCPTCGAELGQAAP